MLTFHYLFIQYIFTEGLIYTQCWLAAAAKSLQLCLTLYDPIDGSSPSLGFSRQEHWSGLPFPSYQCWKVKSESEVAQSCPTLSDPMDCSPPGSSARGIFQARGLEWGAMMALVPSWYWPGYWENKDGYDIYGPSLL